MSDTPNQSGYNQRRRAAQVVAAAASLLPFVLVAALTWLSRSITRGFTVGDGEQIVVSLRVLVGMVVATLLAPTVAAIAARIGGLRLDPKPVTAWFVVWLTGIGLSVVILRS